MKILHVITKSVWGGAQRHVFDLAVHARSKGHDVAVALGGAGILNDRLKEAGVRTIPIAKLGRDMSLSGDLASFKNIFSIIRSEKPDLMHLHSPKAAALGALAGRLLSVQRIITTVHGWSFNENRPRWQKMLIMLASWVTALLCTDTVVLSRYELAQGRALPFISGKLRLIPLGIEIPKFAPLKESLALFSSKIAATAKPETGEPRTEEPFNLSHKTVIGTISELHPNKGLIYLIDAFHEIAEKFQNAVMLIVGEGEERAMLESRIADKRLSDRIFLVGRIPDAASHAKIFDIFTLTSVKEGLPYTILEAGAAGVAVIASAVGGIPEIIDDMKSGLLIQPKKSAEIAHALEFLLTHVNVRKSYGKELHQKVAADFNIETMFGRIDELYAELQ
ncbi:MAG: hypothetical protein JWO73_442 [Candidatus Taylorbacteria bacterium]|nr:hypothetical protein [Candidatus Taylorbacteria bacterium]